VQSFGGRLLLAIDESRPHDVRQSAVANFLKLSAFSRRSPDGDTTANAVEGAGSVRGANQRQAIAGDLPADAGEGAGSVWGANQRYYFVLPVAPGSAVLEGRAFSALGKGSSLALACARGVPLEDRGVNDGTGDGGAYYNA
jgi:hypothetical protein